MISKYRFLIVILIFSQACQKAVVNEVIIYENNFETSDLSNTTGVIVNTYASNKVAGFYNSGGFSVSLSNLPAHDFLRISFNLYIHNYWDGNSTGNRDVTTGPDIWRMEVDDEQIVNTTFSNTVCNEVYCLQQSFPKNFPWQNNPGTGASNLNLPGLCGSGGITRLYRIEKLVKHSGGTGIVKFSDLLRQSNVPDKLCDESWSLDDVKITTLSSQ